MKKRNDIKKNQYLNSVYELMYLKLFKKYYIDDFLGVNKKQKHETKTNKRTTRKVKDKVQEIKDK